MVVIYEPDARNERRIYPVEVTCTVCGNGILYRLGVSEAAKGGVFHRRCPVCGMESTYQVPDDTADLAAKYLEDTTPPEVREAAERWFNKNRQDKERIKKYRENDPDYARGQPKGPKKARRMA